MQCLDDREFLIRTAGVTESYDQLEVPCELGRASSPGSRNRSSEIHPKNQMAGKRDLPGVWLLISFSTKGQHDNNGRAAPARSNIHFAS